VPALSAHYRNRPRQAARLSVMIVIVEKFADGERDEEGEGEAEAFEEIDEILVGVAHAGRVDGDELLAGVLALVLAATDFGEVLYQRPVLGDERL